jgi:hypothetical protein
MQIFLEEIAFNHGDRPVTGALTIRRNATQTVPLPEWRRDSCSSPECAPAAYVISGLPKVLTVKARFSSPDTKNTEVRIQVLARKDDVLGSSEPASVRFDNDGQTEFVRFVLLNNKITDVGVSANTIEWQWQFEIKSSWTTFQHTQHRIYAVQGNPKDPWDKELPWTDVLEVACRWAIGEKESDEIAAAITREVYGLGKGLVTYDRTPTYAHARFDCTAFLQLLAGSPIAPQVVNCDDCATIVSTFANILGCDLSQSGMGLIFGTKPIVLIGRSNSSTPTFKRHAVAWKGECTKSQSLFDACLAVNVKLAPEKLDDSILPINIPFGSSRQPNSYKFLLFASGECNPRPKVERTRRPLGPSYPASARLVDDEHIAFLKSHFQFDQWPQTKNLDTKRHLSDVSAVEFVGQHGRLRTWDLECLDATGNEDLTTVVQILLPIDYSRLAEMNFYEARETTSASVFLLRLLAEFHQTDVKRVEGQAIGEIAFEEPSSTAVVFRRGPFLAFVRSVGREPIACSEMAALIDRYFLALLS